MNDSAKVEKFVVFKIVDYFLALPISAVVKAIDYPLGNEAIASAGLVQIGQHMLKLLDLHQITSNATSKTHAPFLVITQLNRNELYAIPVEEPPNLVELPRDSIRALPRWEHCLGLLELVSHVAEISEAGQPLTVFLLDINRAIASTKGLAPRLIAEEN
jgi:purine-binding chemotaxis protein CheW